MPSATSPESAARAIALITTEAITKKCKIFTGIVRRNLESHRVPARIFSQLRMRYHEAYAKQSSRRKLEEKIMLTLRAGAALLLSMCGFMMLPAFAQAPAYPARNVQIIVPYTPGGS